MAPVERPRPSQLAPRGSLFDSFLMGGFESSSHRTTGGRQLDLIAATRHDRFAYDDYSLLARHGITTVRDALRWHLIERAPGRYDWSSLIPMLHAAKAARVQVIWDLCHYGVPPDIDIWSVHFPERFAQFCSAVAQMVAGETGDEVPTFCPMNEISYWAWAAGDHGRMYPASFGQGATLKRQLVRAAIMAIDAVRCVEPRARFVQAEPLIHVAGHPDIPETAAGAEQHRNSQFEALDMLTGRTSPELVGTEGHLDIVGINFYPENQILRAGGTIPLGHWLYRPLRHMLAEVHARYDRPLLLTETGAEAENGAGWLRYVAGEARAAMRAGVRLEGVCLYPIMDYPGWDNGRHCRCGLIRLTDDWERRDVDLDLLEQLEEERHLFIRAGFPEADHSRSWRMAGD